MKFSLAFVLIALFAVITISQALPRPEETAASNNDGTSVNTKIEIELTKEQALVVEAMGRKRFWKKILKGVIEGIKIACKVIDCQNATQNQNKPQ
uniref:Uncharacterized protein n=1 Tax=Anopheles coluzzii TaxID=1518534 RepID=A0A6E8VSR5_ANOCL